MSENQGNGSILKGKGDDSTKSKKGSRVQFSDEDSPANTYSKSGGKGETPIGGPLKTDKGGKTASGKKGSTLKETKYELNVQSVGTDMRPGNILELPKNAQCMMDCEAADILQGIQEQMVFLSRDPNIKLPISFDKGLQYASAGSRYSDLKAVREVLENLKRHGASDGEICVIANACPESVDEAFALLPSLKAKRSQITEQLKDVLAELIKLKLPAEGFKE
ncbi:hypothetical protein RND81_03G026200 [Saponaria officinalis]|uniref:RNA polymerase Rpb4/RPC9 core domain-containing protein n=1 Tax=Saponaria officinalis TaxID=3572 RepID=A0AAW1M3Z5_SAPOF